MTDRKIQKPAKKGTIPAKVIKAAVAKVTAARTQKPINLPKPHRPFPKESELADRIDNLLDEYAEQIAAVAVVGILQIIALRVMNDAIAREDNL